MISAAVRLGVDIGGTFTDVVLEKDGEVFSTKVLTTYSAPENAIVDGMRQVCAKAGVAASEVVQIIHGTTLATNALIERRGAKTALITTQGFRDVIEMRTESRFEQYDLNLVLPDPLLPRQMRFTVNERVNAKGEAVTLVSPRDMYKLKSIEKLISIEVPKLQPPDELGPGPNWKDGGRSSDNKKKYSGKNKNYKGRNPRRQ